MSILNVCIIVVIKGVGCDETKTATHLSLRGADLTFTHTHMIMSRSATVQWHPSVVTGDVHINLERLRFSYLPHSGESCTWLERGGGGEIV